MSPCRSRCWYMAFGKSAWDAAPSSSSRENIKLVNHGSGRRMGWIGFELKASCLVKKEGSVNWCVYEATRSYSYLTRKLASWNRPSQSGVLLLLISSYSVLWLRISSEDCWLWFIWIMNANLTSGQFCSQIPLKHKCTAILATLVLFLVDMSVGERMPTARYSFKNSLRTTFLPAANCSLGFF